MTKITIHGQKMQFHKIPKCRVSFMTGSGAFSTYDNNGVTVDGTSIEVPIGTTLSYVSWVQGTVFAFYIGNKQYTVYKRNGYSGTTKYLEGITIDGVAFTRGTYTITGDIEIDALGVRNGISITYALSPQPTPTPPLAPIIYPSGVLVNKVTLNYDGYAAIISFDEGEPILISEQQGYEATGASVSAPTALYADTTITVYLQQLVTCSLVDWQTAGWTSPNDKSNGIRDALQQFVGQYGQFQNFQAAAPSNLSYAYILYDGSNCCGLAYGDLMYVYYDPQSGQPFSTNTTAIVVFFDDGYNLYATPYEIYPVWQYQVLPQWSNTSLSDPRGYVNQVFNYGDENVLGNWIQDWNCGDTCGLMQTIYNLATNK